MGTNSVNSHLGELLTALAPEFGFPLAGVLDLEKALSALSSHVTRFDRWLASGFHDRLEYLHRGRDRRADPRLLFSEARGILCVAAPYGPRDDDPPDDPARARYARYLRGRDYHRVMTERLTALLERAAKEIPFRFKVCCDTSAVLERSFAYMAGLGWIGKNTCLIHTTFGSYLFLAEALLDVSPGGSPEPMRDHCGLCERCQTLCPTSAFPRAHALDARRCISNWTLERRGDLALSEADKAAIGDLVAGCDTCQEVCPFNRKPRPKILPEFSDPIDDATKLTDWAGLTEESDDQYQERTRNSALSRVKPADFKRNLSLAQASLHMQEFAKD